MTSLINEQTKIKVSSTLDKSVGKKNLTDGSLETCWTSAQGFPQFIHLLFPSPVIPTELSIAFQGGFVGTRCAVHVLPSKCSQATEWRFLIRLFPEDTNSRQKFSLPLDDFEAIGIEQIKLVFEESSDLFGRITVYDLELRGDLCNPESS